MTGQPSPSRPRRHKIIVVSSTDPQGQVSPLSFTWRNANYTIASWGRRWRTAGGEHFLVMTAAGRMFELVYRPQDGTWYLQRAAPTQSTV